ncbi:MAG: Gfo/Idh/MocA family oxidoreductase [Candidatus Omnitrophica bacterium]|nr:Gfo/Idh/MocA family oxidoreductase [Candidatus Omnitrophota bacterium]
MKGSEVPAVVVGYGAMGREHLKALRSLSVQEILVCSRSESSLAPLRENSGIRVISGGFQSLREGLSSRTFGIVATPTASLIPAAERLVSLGVRTLLIEKPVALEAAALEEFSRHLQGTGVTAFCGYNRVGYPSFLEALARTKGDGGITSCRYTFTELLDRIDPGRFDPRELSRWGIANSLHVLSMAHRAIGLPERWSAHRSGQALDWHPAGSIFVGSGLSVEGIPFSYHADWGSAGRWSVELYTAKAAYRLCPLEKLFQKTDSLSDWEEIPVESFAPEVKAGFAEQAAACIDLKMRRWIPLISIEEAAQLTRFAEALLGYADEA